MKCRCNCGNCGYMAKITVDVVPAFCPQCGSNGIFVDIEKPKSRVTAESKMVELDELRPRLESAWNEYWGLRVAYEDLLQFLVVYKRRGIVSEEELSQYRVNDLCRKQDLNAAIKEYRAKKWEESL